MQPFVSSSLYLKRLMIYTIPWGSILVVSASWRMIFHDYLNSERMVLKNKNFPRVSSSHCDLCWLRAFKKYFFCIFSAFVKIFHVLKLRGHHLFSHLRRERSCKKGNFNVFSFSRICHVRYSRLTSVYEAFIRRRVNYWLF